LAVLVESGFEMKTVKVGDSNFTELWQRLFLESEFQYPLYQPWNIKYYDAFFRESVFVDCSFVIEEKGIPIIGLRVAYDELSNGTRKLSFFGLPILYVENPNVPPTQIRGARKAQKVEWQTILETYELDFINYRDFSNDALLSFFGQQLLDHGALASPYLTQIIDLSLPEMELYGEIRKSYKSLINWGRKNLVLTFLNSETMVPEDIERFRLLHFHASGRETRSLETWELQYEMIVHREAFAVLGELDDELVTASLFPYSAKYCYYGVSASNRDLFEKPLSHVIMWKAIQYAKEIGCRFFEVGQQYYPKQNSEITQKEFNISTFKHGFGGRTNTRLNIVWER